MPTFQLVETTTKDSLIHQGVFFKGSKPTHKALLWVHGLTSNFYSHVTLLNNCAVACEESGFGFAAFNNRGHDLVSSIHKVDPSNPKGYSRFPAGASQERFEDSIHDIDSGIQFLIEQGFEEVILLGHSTGANKVTYYMAHQQDPRVKAVVLTSPLSDRLVSDESAQLIKQNLQKAQTLSEQGEGDTLRTDLFYYVTTPNRLVSLLTPGSDEDTFDYGDPEPKMTDLSKITSPLLVVFGERDEHADRPISEIKKVFDAKRNSSDYKSVVIPDGLHSFGGKEKELISEIISWVCSFK
jgi:pimeloyl-ACP methyl ester carboxylesterase